MISAPGYVIKNTLSIAAATYQTLADRGLLSLRRPASSSNDEGTGCEPLVVGSTALCATYAICVHLFLLSIPHAGPPQRGEGVAVGRMPQGREHLVPFYVRIHGVL